MDIEFRIKNCEFGMKNMRRGRLFIQNSQFEILNSPSSIIFPMSEAPTPPPPSRRRRLLWTLLGAMVLVGLLPLVVSHYFLIGINRDSLETLEKKYLTRSAVSIAG